MARGEFTSLGSLLTMYRIEIRVRTEGALNHPFRSNPQDVRLNHVSAEGAIDELCYHTKVDMLLSNLVAAKHDTRLCFLLPFNHSKTAKKGRKAAEACWSTSAAARKWNKTNMKKQNCHDRQHQRARSMQSEMHGLWSRTKRKMSGNRIRLIMCKPGTKQAHKKSNDGSGQNQMTTSL